MTAWANARTTYGTIRGRHGVETPWPRELTAIGRTDAMGIAMWHGRDTGGGALAGWSIPTPQEKQHTTSPLPTPNAGDRPDGDQIIMGEKTREGPK